MKVIHKIAAMVIINNSFLMVRKVNSKVWTNLGGKPESSETEIEALLREIKEELDCRANIIKKLGDFEAKAAESEAIVRLSTYLVTLDGDIHLIDPELEEYKFITKSDITLGISLPESITKYILPFCIKEGLLDW